MANITAYDVKAKKKGVEMKDPVISIKNGRYIASGTAKGSGNKLTAIMSKATAEAHIKAGTAKKGEGWGKEKSK